MTAADVLVQSLQASPETPVLYTAAREINWFVRWPRPDITGGEHAESGVG
jgi:hypothetical protein